MTAQFWVGTGWKMNKTTVEARAYIVQLLSQLPLLPSYLSLFIIPPFTALQTARQALGQNRTILLGAQNMHWAEQGAYTGEISAGMLNEFAVDIVELGHSERRASCGETDQTINAKVKTALKYGMRPLVCVGESVGEYQANASVETVLRQVKMAFAGVTGEQLCSCLIAYEPIWAIGEGGTTADPRHIAMVHHAVRQLLNERTQAHIPILYGGSVDLDNAKVLAAQTGIDGLFIGRAAWSVLDFIKMIQTVIKVKNNQQG